MSAMSDDWDSTEKSLLREALRLGFEVGFRGHIEGVGWVRAKYKELEAEAIKLGIVGVLEEKFEAGKEFGKRKRLSSFATPEGGLVFEKKAPLRVTFAPLKTLPIRVVGDDESSDFIVERVPVKQGIEAVVNLMKLAQKSEKMMQRLTTVFSSMADVHDRLGELKVMEGNREKTMNEGLNLLVDIGWLEDFDIVELDLNSRTAKIDAISEIAKAVGSAVEPICKPVCVALETVGNKTFNVSTLVLEKRCMCQGEHKCRFVFVPRPQLI